MVAKTSETMKSTVPPGTPLIIHKVKEMPGASAANNPAAPEVKDMPGIQRPPASFRRLDYIRQQFLYGRKGLEGNPSGEKSFVVEGKQCRSKSQPARISNGVGDNTSDRGDIQLRKAIRKEEDGSGGYRPAGRQRDVKSSYPTSVALPMLSVGGGGPGFSHRLMSKSRSLPGDRSSDADPGDGSHAANHDSEYLSESETTFDTGSTGANTGGVVGSKGGVSSSLSSSSVSPRKVSKKVNNFFPKAPPAMSHDDYNDICVDMQKSSGTPKMSITIGANSGSNKPGTAATPLSVDGKPATALPAGMGGEMEMSRSKTITLTLNSENAARNGGSRRSNSFRSRTEGSPATGRVGVAGGNRPYHDMAAVQASQASLRKRQMGQKYIEAIEVKVPVEDSTSNDPLRASTEAKPVPKKVVAKYSDIAIQRDLDDFFQVKPAFT